MINDKTIITAASLISIGISMLASLGVGIGQGIATGKAVEAVGRQPEAKSDIISTLLIGCAVSETTAIYALLISFILLFANPFLKI